MSKPVPELTKCDLRYRCHRTWEELLTTGDAKVRYCDLCARNVFALRTRARLNVANAVGRCMALATTMRSLAGSASRKGPGTGWKKSRKRCASALAMTSQPMRSSECNGHSHARRKRASNGCPRAGSRSGHSRLTLHAISRTKFGSSFLASTWRQGQSKALARSERHRASGQTSVCVIARRVTTMSDKPYFFPCAH